MPSQIGLGWDLENIDINSSPVAAQYVELAQGLGIGTEFLALASGSPRKAAFTLRLDQERHRRLRMASAARGISAQKLLIEAFDLFLAGHDACTPTDLAADGGCHVAIPERVKR